MSQEIREMIDEQAEVLESAGFHKQSAALDMIGLELDVGSQRALSIRKIVEASTARGETKFASVISAVEKEVGVVEGLARDFARLIFNENVPPSYRDKQASNVTLPSGDNKKLQLRRQM
ncbi:MAG: hypothetical protein WC895_04985, partial [Candidatus Shapirobacteria bacterium]